MSKMFRNSKFILFISTLKFYLHHMILNDSCCQWNWRQFYSCMCMRVFFWLACLLLTGWLFSWVEITQHILHITDSCSIGDWGWFNHSGLTFYWAWIVICTRFILKMSWNTEKKDIYFRPTLIAATPQISWDTGRRKEDVSYCTRCNKVLFDPIKNLTKIFSIL